MLSRNVDELLATTTSRELAEWRAFMYLRDEDYEKKTRESMRTQSDSNAMILSIFKGLQAKNANTKN